MLPVLYAVAAVLELAGLMLAGHGLMRTWREFSDEPVKLSTAALTPANRAARQAWAWIKRRLGVEQAVTLRVNGAFAPLRGSLSANVYGLTGPLPSIVEQPDEFAAEVHRLIVELQDSLGRTRLSLQEEATARESDVEALRGELRELDDRMSANVKKFAIGGLVEAFWGWVFLLAALALSTVANFVSLS